MRTQAATSAGAAALIEAVNDKKHHGWITLDSNGFDAFRYGLTLQIDGAWLPIDDEGIHVWSFFKEKWMTQTMAEFQLIFYNAWEKEKNEALAELVDKNPGRAQDLLDEFIANQDAARLPAQRALTPDEQMIDDYVAANKQYAETVRLKTEKAMAPLIFIAEMFAIDGPVDLLQTVVPVEKVGAKLFNLGREALKARKARKLERLLIKEFEDNLDEEAKAFLEIARGLSKSEIQRSRRSRSKSRATP